MKLRSSLGLLVAFSSACWSPRTNPSAEMDGSTSLDAAQVDACARAVEICGDRMDQNCDGRDTSCGDTDKDGVEACRPGQLPPACDCDDSKSTVRPPFGGLAGAFESCDELDNDCDGRIDESAACCAGCESLGDHRERADVCLEDGTCECSAAPGTGPCASGETCCELGCIDTSTSLDNCGGCGVQCDMNANDRCVDGQCRCGDTSGCDGEGVCRGGVCG
jgi:Putative metal-binding motif